MAIWHGWELNLRPPELETDALVTLQRFNAVGEKRVIKTVGKKDGPTVIFEDLLCSK
ncbi:hypothetical protein ElyMa_003429500, partial [Elysia marginata]